jgi:hypothetical protein
MATPSDLLPGAMRVFQVVIWANVEIMGRGRVSSRASSRKPGGKVEMVMERGGGKGWDG